MRKYKFSTLEEDKNEDQKILNTIDNIKEFDAYFNGSKYFKNKMRLDISMPELSKERKIFLSHIDHHRAFYRDTKDVKIMFYLYLINEGYDFSE